MNIEYNNRLKLIFGLCLATGILTLSSALITIARSHHIKVVLTDEHLTVIAGISLVYLAMLLRRGKYNAWLVALVVYTFLIIRNFQHYVFDVQHEVHPLGLILNLGLPIVTFILLILFKGSFNVRSELVSFAQAARRAVLILLVAFAYGIVGFHLMDDSDFHQEVGLIGSAHYTVDQFGLTTNKAVTPYTKRAVFFLDSLGAVTIGALSYAAISFFSPIRFRLRHSQADIDDLTKLLKRHSDTSEDFFKLWPRDKAYLFNTQRTACIAYKSNGGIALAVGDPVGPKPQIAPLIKDFMRLCEPNDWTPAFIHTDQKYLDIYKALGFEAQKIGEEAIVETTVFAANVAGNKYFRHINNKFSKLGYTTEILQPPHSQQILKELHKTSTDWLRVPGRAERGFMLGYFSGQYMNQCRIMVAKNSQGQLEAFINEVPSPMANEANFDFLRHKSGALGNINDFLMLRFIENLNRRGIARLNMGLAPLSGLGGSDKDQKRLINSFLNFAYANGNRFYSFKGLKRFKAKYEPQWQERYIIYRGGTAGFTKTMNSLIRAMKLHRRY